MPRPKKTAVDKSAEAKPKTYKLTAEQFESLRKIGSLVEDTRRLLGEVEDLESGTAVTFVAGKAYTLADQAEDLIDGIINEFDDMIDWSDEDDSF